MSVEVDRSVPWHDVQGISACAWEVHIAAVKRKKQNLKMTSVLEVILRLLTNIGDALRFPEF